MVLIGDALAMTSAVDIVEAHITHVLMPQSSAQGPLCIRLGAVPFASADGSGKPTAEESKKPAKPEEASSQPTSMQGLSPPQRCWDAQCTRKTCGKYHGFGKTCRQNCSCSRFTCLYGAYAPVATRHVRPERCRAVPLWQVIHFAVCQSGLFKQLRLLRAPQQPRLLHLLQCRPRLYLPQRRTAKKR